MRNTHQQAVQAVTILILQALALPLLAAFLPGFTAATLSALLALTIPLALAQALSWWLFTHFCAWLPVWLFPVLTFALDAPLVYWAAGLIPGSAVATIGTANAIALCLSLVNALLAGLFSLNDDERFDRTVLLPMLQLSARADTTEIPGFLFLEIDGLGEAALRRALAAGRMATVKRWLDSGAYCLVGWETDYSSQTGAMQAGILLGSNGDIPAYRWWDRSAGQVVISGSLTYSRAIEARLSAGYGLLSHGGASRGNIFSGDATESLFTFSTLTDLGHPTGPAFYRFLANPYCVARLAVRFVEECSKEWSQQYLQRLRHDKYIVSSRNFKYAFLRGFMLPVLQDLVTTSPSTTSSAACPPSTPAMVATTTSPITPARTPPRP